MNISQKLAQMQMEARNYLLVFAFSTTEQYKLYLLFVSYKCNLCIVNEIFYMVKIDPINLNEK